MAKTNATCDVPGCNNTLSDEQEEKKTTVCSSCEAAKMHLCESCGKKLAPKRIKDGATICQQCEMNPTDFEEQPEAERTFDYEEEDEPEDFMV